MAKLSVDTTHEYEYRDGTMTVAQALKWVEDHATSEDEETGEVSTYTPGDLICYGVRRMMALHKDGARFAKGKAPARIYTPRVAVEGAAKNAGAVKEAAREAFAKALHIVETKHASPAAPVTRKAVKVAPPVPAKVATQKAAANAAKLAANAARIAEIEAALAKKTAPKAKLRWPSPPAPKAKPAQSAKPSRPGIKRDDTGAGDAMDTASIMRALLASAP